MSILNRLFGKGGAPASASEPEHHEGFAIYPEPIREGGKWRISARIVKIVGGTEKTHLLIRADTLDSEDAAITASLGKARQMIDEQGERLFD